jgi:hypothetical protein
MLKSTWPKFESFRARCARVLEKSLFSNKEAKIKEKEKGRCWITQANPRFKFNA